MDSEYALKTTHLKKGRILGLRSGAPPWRKVFLEALRNTGNVTLAADTAGVHRNTAYDAKDD